MKKNLTIEQSQKLFELGIDPKLASADRYDFDREGNELHEYIFTLTDLLSILPKEIYSKKENIYYSLTMVMQIFPLNSSAYYAHSVQGKFSPIKKSPELIDALYSLLVWIKTEGVVEI